MVVDFVGYPYEACALGILYGTAPTLIVTATGMALVSRHAAGLTGLCLSSLERYLQPCSNATPTSAQLLEISTDL